MEYCDLYPFDNVYRRTFHYDDVVFLNNEGIFDRVGTGAWGTCFKTIQEPERLGYYAEYGFTREGPGSRIPDSIDGSVWILGDNPQRGNILYRRGDWTVSPGMKPTFSLCNGFVDIHNRLNNLKIVPGKETTVNFTVEVFCGRVPDLDRLNTMYQKSAGGMRLRQITEVHYADDGVITGFATK